MPWIRIEDKPGAQEERSSRSSLDGLGFVVTVISVAGVLSMVATWFLAAYFPIPADNAVHLGLLVFLFVLFITFPLAVLPFLEGRGRAAIKASLSFAVSGLIAAVALGSLPLLWSRLIAAMPWIQEFPLSTFLLALFLAASGLWRKRNSTENDHRYSWKLLIFQGSLIIFLITSTLLSAVFRFSGGKAWLGAFYLAIALLFGLHAVKVFAEIWRIWRRRRENSHESAV